MTNEIILIKNINNLSLRRAIFAPKSHKSLRLIQKKSSRQTSKKCILSAGKKRLPKLAKLSQKKGLRRLLGTSL